MLLYPLNGGSRLNDLIMVSKHRNKTLWFILLVVCVCLWPVVQTWWGGCLLMVFAQSGVINRSCGGGGVTLTLPRVCFWCVDLRTPWADWSLCPPRWLICSVHRSLQPVLASANWQSGVWLCTPGCCSTHGSVLCVRFTECARHPGVEDGGLWATDVWVGSWVLSVAAVSIGYIPCAFWSMTIMRETLRFRRSGL